MHHVKENVGQALDTMKDTVGKLINFMEEQTTAVLPKKKAAPVPSMGPVFSDICRGSFNLKHVETRESKPCFDKNFRLKKVDRKPLFDAIKRGNTLKMVPRAEVKRFQMEKGWKLRKNHHKDLFEEVKRGKKLNHVTKMKDCSAPYFHRWGTLPIDELLKQVSQGCELNRVKPNDRSKPAIEKGMRIKKSNRKPMFEELTKGVQLKHVETIEENTLPCDIHLHKSPRKSLLKQIPQEHNLKHVWTYDRSEPQFERYGLVPIPEPLLKDVTKGFKLSHVSTCDKSKPCIDKGLKIKKLDREPFLGEVQEGVSLKHVETQDKTQPKIPRNFHLQSRMDMAKITGTKCS